MATSIGIVTGQVRAVGYRGVVTYARAETGGCSIYSGDSGTNTLIATLSASESMDSEVEFDGLYITGNCVIHLK